MLIEWMEERQGIEQDVETQQLMQTVMQQVLADEGIEMEVMVGVTFVDPERIREINRDFRKIDKPTDVLSFPLTDYGELDYPVADEPEQSLGDIVLSLERADEQAREFGHPFEREVAFLTVHSMLHLLGYDHVNSDEEDAEMRRRQREILESMGLGV
jgi:probable rRNA maturation factor